MNKIREFYGRLRKGKGVLLPAWREAYGEVPAVSFTDLIDAYLKDPSCKAFIDFLADQAVGMGFYTVVNEEYARFEEAKRVVDEFNESVNLDGLLQISTREIVACGNSFWEKIEPERLETLKILPITSVEKIIRTATGEVEGYKQTAMYGGKVLDPGRIIHFCWNPVNGEPFGTGALRVLLERMSFDGETRISFLEMKARIEDVMPDVFEKYVGPEAVYIFEGASEEKVAEYQQLIRTMPKAGARWVYNKPADIKTVQIDPRMRFAYIVEHVVNQVYLGGQTPLPKLFTTPGFTEASARAALETAERKVMSLQRFIKRICERDIFWPVIQQAGLDPKKADCRLIWGAPEVPELLVSDQLKAFELSVIRRDELRKVLVKQGWELWEPEEVGAHAVEKK